MMEKVFPFFEHNKSNSILLFQFFFTINENKKIQKKQQPKAMRGTGSEEKHDRALSGFLTVKILNENFSQHTHIACENNYEKYMQQNEKPNVNNAMSEMWKFSHFVCSINHSYACRCSSIQNKFRMMKSEKIFIFLVKTQFLQVGSGRENFTIMPTTQKSVNYFTHCLSSICSL
jgi:hypothetical protein